MMAVQRLRRMARSMGNLESAPQQQVIVERDYIQILPAQPRLIYVPVYDPAVVYVRRRPSWGTVLVSFGVGFALGAWLNHDCDWRYHRVYYHGWRGGGWVARSRPVVHMTNVYVNNQYTNVTVNRTVVNRSVNYANVSQFNSVHSGVTYNNRVHSRTRAINSNQQVVNPAPNRSTNINNDRGRWNRPRPASEKAAGAEERSPARSGSARVVPPSAKSAQEGTPKNGGVPGPRATGRPARKGYAQAGWPASKASGPAGTSHAHHGRAEKTGSSQGHSSRSADGGEK
jgi:hypothetical protein